MGKIKTPAKTTTIQTGSSGTKKQSSLMSFFRPISSIEKPKENKIPIISSPLSSKTSIKQEEASSDKENDNTMLQENEDHFTSSMTSPPEFIQPKQTPLKERTHTLNSSPVLTNKRGARKINYNESESESEVEITTRKKRKILPVDSDGDDDIDGDFKPVSEDEDLDDFVVEDDLEEEDKQDSEEEKEISKPRKKITINKPPSTKTCSSNLTEKFHAASSYDNSNYKPQQYSSKPVSQKKNFEKQNEERYQWLINIKDAEKRDIDHPDYDPRTLYIPQSAWSKFTNFEKQYWEIKSKYWNTVVFFQKGKFYELYENDAAIANTQFDLKIAGGGRANMKLAGIPHMSFDYWSNEFIKQGYKVAKVDQIESQLSKDIRGGGSKEEKIIKRELTNVLTGGTLTNLEMITDDMATYCLSIKEQTQEDGSKIFGVAFVDTATSELSLVELEDDAECTKLETLITQVRPKEVICEKGNLCKIATKILKYCAHSNNQIWNNLNPITEFWDYDITLEHLVKSRYYAAEDLDDFSNYPKVLLEFKNKYVAFNALGGLLSYLKILKLDESIMSLGNIHHYQISKNQSSHLILDGITLSNLEILNNNYDGSDQGTLLKLINRASTAFGKRLLKQWVLHPLVKISDINDRYDSVEFLLGDGLEIRAVLQECLANLPDLERLIARIHGRTLRFKDFLKVIESFENIAKFSNTLLEFANVECGILYKFLKNFPEEMAGYISEWEDAFNRQEAKNDIIIPAEGVDEEFDNSQTIMSDIEAQLNQKLKDYKKQYRSQEIIYRDIGKEIYLIELPLKLVKNVPQSWDTMGATKTTKRFWSPEVKELARKLLEQREIHKSVCDTLKLRMYERFDQHYQTWMKVITTIANIDCILALTSVSESIGYPSCRPTFVESDQGLVDFQELRHPCFVGTKEFIPNDIKLGGDEPNFGLLTGANAAGKSTIMRTTALAILMSQIGCYVPSRLAKLTPVDRIMTRLGANDNIMQGKSTFFVELSETKKILDYATQKSFVIIDELGRGGSTTDGFAIAEAVLHHLATHIRPIGFFATHYNTLGLSFKTHPQVKPLRMGIILDQDSRKITFLYKLESGVAPGSFGMNVALMCGIPKEIVDNAEIEAKEYEKISSLKKTKVENMSLGLQSDAIWYAKGLLEDPKALEIFCKMIDQL
ncbi:MSH6 [Candida jiufengensis]|uniref:MSH6 n=1 Tax=Candida jiufengensis TaxID=497108 RepID=UPI002225AD07|nr:MSH6 [Candida jiufengensis]KAI5950965.1 MSH6 [Candida jiufengensis]